MGPFQPHDNIIYVDVHTNKFRYRFDNTDGTGPIFECVSYIAFIASSSFRQINIKSVLPSIAIMRHIGFVWEQQGILKT